MIRRLGAWLLAGLLAGASCAFAQSLAPIPPLTSPVVDTTGTLNAGEIAQLEQQALALQQRKGSQLQILIVPTTQPEAIEQYAQRVFDEWKLGRSNVDDGVLLLVAKDDREVRIQPGYGLEGAIPDIAAGRIVQEYLVPKFRTGDFAGGIGDASAQLMRLIDGETLPEPMAPLAQGNDGSDWSGGIFFAFIAALFGRTLFGRLPMPLRMLLVGGVAGGAVWLSSGPWWAVLLAALIGAVFGAAASSARYANRGGWGTLGIPTSSGRSSGGGWSGGSGSSGWSGGGGRSGGGGASGRW
ncbi:MAG: TPM domain-containing protein [Lysobacteraceae bacterium]